MLSSTIEENGNLLHARLGEPIFLSNLPPHEVVVYEAVEEFATATQRLFTERGISNRGFLTRRR